ncbi:MAG: replication-associated recombination protein A [Bacteroidales bacterium]|jgi:putative ATPase|nr:replication-associated recombination protein A [Bacteroidales bacterium]
MIPLAQSLRPNNLDEYVGQRHLVGENAILRNAIEKGNIPSMILYGPPGVGKTTLASIIAEKMFYSFYSLSAINSGVKEVREVIDRAKKESGAILFIDEIHRFSKNQQDSLLSAVEKGIITLIGATTENPSFEIITPLLSRMQVFILKPLDKDDLEILIQRAKTFYKEKYNRDIIIEEKEALMRISGGDARKLFNAIEVVVSSLEDNIITNDKVNKIIQNNLSAYDKNGEMHYDIISAFIKSMRGSDPNGAVYWLARMIEGGEDPLFIARRMLILASEDIGIANPNALILANACFDAVSKVGYPECRIILSQTAIYLATSPKSNSTYMAIENALEKVRLTGNLSVPLHLRNAPTKLMKELGYGENYLYAHNYKDNFVPQNFLPDEILGEKFYQAGNNPKENEIRKHLSLMWKDFYSY